MFDFFIACYRLGFMEDLLNNQPQMKPFDKIETDKAFPGMVHLTEGVHIELRPDSLVVFIQKPSLSINILSAFKKGFSQYSYLESNTLVPIPYWVFKFPQPHGPVECAFNARVVQPEYIKSFLDTTDGIKNGVHFYLLDGQILRGKKLFGLSTDAIKLFHYTIRKQMGMNYSRTDFDRYLIELFQFDAQELFEMGKIFKRQPL
jgi:hypothetical protein